MNTLFDTVIIGHISVDFNTDHLGNTVKQFGGAVIYSSYAAVAGGNNVAVITKAAPGEKAETLFNVPKENIWVLPSDVSTSIENIYLTADKERRNCRAISVAKPFSIGDIPPIKTKIWHLAGLIYGDFSEDMIFELSKTGKVAVDVQGFLRHATSEGMIFKDWENKKKCLPSISFLKADAAEAEVMTGLTDRREAAKLLYSWGAQEIMISHNTEMLIYDGKTFYTKPVVSRNLSGRTGRGDTVFSAYITERLRSPIDEALLYATAAVSLKMEKPEPLKATRSEIEEYIKELY